MSKDSQAPEKESLKKALSHPLRREREARLYQPRHAVRSLPRWPTLAFRPARDVASGRSYQRSGTIRLPSSAA